MVVIVSHYPKFVYTLYQIQKIDDIGIILLLDGFQARATDEELQGVHHRVVHLGNERGIRAIVVDGAKVANSHDTEKGFPLNHQRKSL